MGGAAIRTCFSYFYCFICNPERPIVTVHIAVEMNLGVVFFHWIPYISWHFRINVAIVVNSIKGYAYIELALPIRSYCALYSLSIMRCKCNAFDLIIYFTPNYSIIRFKLIGMLSCFHSNTVQFIMLYLCGARCYTSHLFDSFPACVRIYIPFWASA